MSFFALGVNHQTASVELREQVAFNAERLRDLLTQQHRHADLNDMVVVSTCNRTEVYAMTEHADLILNWLAETNGIEIKQLLHHVYRYQDAQAVTHLMRVASGLDSLMLGEPQILGQVKSALALSKDAQTVSSDLNRILNTHFMQPSMFAPKQRSVAMLYRWVMRLRNWPYRCLVNQKSLPS